MTSLPETSLKKRAVDKRFFPRPAVQRPGSPACFRSWSAKRMLQRWKECWRQAAPADPGNASMGEEVIISKPVPPVRKPEVGYNPKAGMRGKNVQWVPCSPVVLDKMLDMAKITPDDFVIDPGSGDGRIVIGAARLGAKAIGIESNPKLVALSRKNAEKESVGDRATFAVGDFFKTDYSGATVITLFLRKDLNLKLRPKILGLKPGTRVVSNIFDMGDWEADEVVKVEDGDYCFKNHTVRLWVVPAKVDGNWKLPEGELVISQKFQIISGTLRTGDKTVSIGGNITGNRIDFTADGRRFSGQVIGNRMILEASSGSGQPSAITTVKQPAELNADC